MPKRTVELLLEDILGALAKIERYLEGLNREGFLSDEKTVDAVLRNLETIGEAVKNLPDDFKTQHSGIPWPQIAGLRNRIVHDYAGIDLELVWVIVETALPKFSQQLKRISFRSH